jgi:hypothetical protein
MRPSGRVPRQPRELEGTHGFALCEDPTTFIGKQEIMHHCADLAERSS